MKPSLWMLALPLALAGCGASDNDPGPGGVTVGEAQELNEAAAALDVNAATQDVAINQEAPQ
jgi:hypothetical protein